MNQEFALDIPVAFIIYNRLDTTIRVFERIRNAKPLHLYLISDAPRRDRDGEEEAVRKVRDYVEGRIDWKCDLHRNYAQENMGCKARVASGISWVFEHEDRAIILEDDCLPDSTFFPYCRELLNRYKDDERISMIGGYKTVPQYDSSESYFFSIYSSIWGWATWKRAWALYDKEMEYWPEFREGDRLKPVYDNNILYQKKYRENEKVYNQEFDTWDYQWHFSRVINNTVGIVPKYNLIQNIGIGPGATHTTAKKNQCIGELERMQFPMIHPKYVFRNYEYDKLHVQAATKRKYGELLKTMLGRIIKELKCT